MPAGRAEPRLGAVRAPNEEVQVVLPRVPDAAVHLDAVLRGASRRGARGGFGDVGGTATVPVAGIDRHGRVLDRAVGPLDREGHVGELVLDGLKRPDGTVELDALLGVLVG